MLGIGCGLVARPLAFRFFGQFFAPFFGAYGGPINQALSNTILLIKRMVFIGFSRYLILGPVESCQGFDPGQKGFPDKHNN